MINKGDTKLEDEIEEVYRIGKYDQGKSRPLKIKLKSQTAGEETLVNVWKLAKSNKFKQVWIRREMNEEERKKLNELRSEAKERNEQRTQEERELFFWRVMDLRLRKWYVRSEGCRGTTVREGGTWTVAYTNVDGLVSVMDEVNEFIKANEPDIMAMVETKLRNSETPNLGGGKYNMCIRNRCRKGGGGVMMLVKKGIRV